MSLIQWKQIDPELRGDANLTGSLHLSGTFFLNNVDILEQVAQSGIFKQTGSYWSTTNDIKITGSFSVELDGDTQELTVSVSGSKRVKVSSEGVVVLFPFLETPTPVVGGMMYSGSNELFIGTV